MEGCMVPTFVTEMIRYSKNEGSPEIKLILERIERLHFDIRQLWWNSLYIEDPGERDKTRKFLFNTCHDLKVTQEMLRKYRRYYLGNLEERLTTFTQINEDYYLRLKAQGLMM